ncbi:MAG: HPr family phosphocarrier protein [Acidobacteriota bacterium]|jgi:phosphocarrier protein
MVRRELEIRNKLGLHARAAAKFVRCAADFSATLTIVRGDMRVDGKSIMGVLLLAAPMGTVLEVIAEGDDEKAAIDAIARLVEDKFGED